jgi:hypothetical protein
MRLEGTNLGPWEAMAFMQSMSIWVTPFCVVLGFLVGPAPFAQEGSNAPPESFTALAVNMSNVGRTGTATVDIDIKRWTSDEERDRLMAIFKEQGPEKLLSALSDTPRVGTIRTPDSVAYDLHFARNLPGEDGGRRIVIATDRPIGFWEASSGSRTLDYPFTLIEIHLDKNGHGTGKLSIAAKLTLQDNVLTIEDFANQPVMLTDVRKRG